MLDTTLKESKLIRNMKKANKIQLSLLNFVGLLFTVVLSSVSLIYLSIGYVISDKDVHLPSPAVEIVPSKAAHPYKYAGETVDLQGIDVFKGRISVVDIIGFTGSETISSKSDGHLKSWDSSIDLVNVLKHEIRDGQLSLRGKRVLELLVAVMGFLEFSLV
ncbi:hypothetical protein K7X08_031846 [Anisodus acutangulus]|uniref:Uncharacterized protein n=1 Tax=Anisodus acutangulus TaxID=402998 RepID=A0A9Q1MMZ5_9SOLA|nr:hypothetical protein K7X08_031846 [Anisodus acutangulus]